MPKSVPTASEIPEGPIRLGWRWVPGEEYQYRTIIEQHRAGTTLSRAEQWRYLVRDLDIDNVATLEAHLNGLGAGIIVNDKVVSKTRVSKAVETEKDQNRHITHLRIDMNGRLVSLDNLDFATGLPHRMLCLNLPKAPITPDQFWANDEVLQPFVDLLPPALRTQSSAVSRVLELNQTQNRITAIIETSGAVRVDRGTQVIALSGTAIWNAEHGHLLERTLKVSLPDESLDTPRAAGTLQIRTSLV